mmetsp:Transcript_1930/g.4445  ORF Transcript_1930/g.4445 Transcript_1930/m.4445 type:complete len:303 (-) Transcript_1930:138-1046(-)|eukprot:CAMPEP_0177643392 /NCGR_PEP_ID=MMETSP0447-20121125/8132_1 /TAXON_ID=0 /ORGANISM="Stygamoeba regulata, Strain BSH-02190019" /LENGTH=302 /DNA_ID=CAMNT_0019145687 /DNA_START=116 /DNA_END=1024 /DNA_ORIENTATION=-
MSRLGHVCRRLTGTGPLTESPVVQRIKQLERECEHRIPEDRAFIIRLDGSSFSTYTKHFKRPFDTRISRSMLWAASQTMQHFSCSAAYVFSDEVSLLFPVRENATTGEPIQCTYDGRVEKLLTLTASRLTAKFNHKISTMPFEKGERCQKTALEGNATFDARLLVIPEPDVLMDVFFWRWMDCVRNSKSSFGRQFMSQTELNGLSSNQVVEAVQRTEGKRWEDIGPYFCHGFILKKVLKEKTAYNPLQRKDVCVMRHTVVGASMGDLANLVDSNPDFDFRTLLTEKTVSNPAVSALFCHVVD